MAETFAEYLARYGRANGQYPVIDLDTVEAQPHTVIVTFAGGAEKVIVQFMGVAAGRDGEHLCIDVHEFGDEDVARYTAFASSVPGRWHDWPAAWGVTVLLGVQTDTPAQP